LCDVILSGAKDLELRSLRFFADCAAQLVASERLNAELLGNDHTGPVHEVRQEFTEVELGALLHGKDIPAAA